MFNILFFSWKLFYFIFRLPLEQCNVFLKVNLINSEKRTISANLHVDLCWFNNEGNPGSEDATGSPEATLPVAHKCYYRTTLCGNYLVLAIPLKKLLKCPCNVFLICKTLFKYLSLETKKMLWSFLHHFVCFIGTLAYPLSFSCTGFKASWQKSEPRCFTGSS